MALTSIAAIFVLPKLLKGSLGSANQIEVISMELGLYRDN